ncbi:MAG: WYL domain-containing protein [Ktedonobacteraceae bacterium]
MPNSDAWNKTNRLQQLQLLFWRNPGKQYRTSEIAQQLGVSVDTASLYLNELADSGGRLPLTKEGWYWYLPQGATVQLLPLTLTLSEAASLYLAARLLVMTQNNRNQHVMSALTKLIAVMPDTIAPHQHQLLDMLRERQQNQGNISNIFDALVQAWATHQTVRLRYSPPHMRTFECDFAPYLLEPSGIGHTVYALGKNISMNELRTYKLERIERADLTGKLFEIESDFDGPTLLKRSWGVMYGDEEVVEVHLRFSQFVTKRLKETLWHPSQQIIETPDGCEWKAQIGDTLEIENWIRGWGADCEVLAPQSLREHMVDTARRLARMYGVGAVPAVSSDKPDIDFLNHLYG